MVHNFNLVTKFTTTELLFSIPLQIFSTRSTPNSSQLSRLI